MKWTAKQVCEVYGVDRRTIVNWLKEKVPIPSEVTKRGRVYDSKEVAEWKDARAERKAAERAEREKMPDLEDARTRKVLADARKSELELSALEGESMPTALHVERLRARLDTVSGALNAMHRYVPLIVACRTTEDADRLVDTMIDETRAELYELSDSID